jgi:hypothetical protein
MPYTTASIENLNKEEPLKKVSSRLHFTLKMTELIRECFQKVAKDSRLYVTRSAKTQQIRFMLPDYDAPEDPTKDYPIIFPVHNVIFDVLHTEDPNMITVPLFITPQIAKAIPTYMITQHLGIDRNMIMVLLLTIPRHHFTDSTHVHAYFE